MKWPTLVKPDSYAIYILAAVSPRPRYGTYLLTRANASRAAYYTSSASAQHWESHCHGSSGLCKLTQGPDTGHSHTFSQYFRFVLQSHTPAVSAYDTQKCARVYVRYTVVFLQFYLLTRFNQFCQLGAEYIPKSF